MTKKQPIFIFGPCSAESEEQVISTARELKKYFDKIIFRAGIWKPRTRPGNFEGMGTEALPWLVRVKEEFGFEVCTEVANTDHVEACLKAGIDQLWIGARTTVNPFSVQEIADALQGVDIPVMVKNPIHPDFNLWLGAIERIEKAGIKEISAIHRGFHHYDNAPYRNYPDWDMAIKMKTMRPHTPVICDASHISGIPSLIPHVAQKALNLDMDGLLIETHIQPEVALSDAKQQVTPSQLNDIIRGLDFKKPTSDNPDYTEKISALRTQIDALDEQIIESIGKRMNLAEDIGKYKHEQGVTVFQQQRWAFVRQRYFDWGASLGLSPPFIETLLTALHDESILKQEIEE